MPGHIPRRVGPLPPAWFRKAGDPPQATPETTVVAVVGDATAAGGSNTPAVTPVATAGAATGAGGQQTPSVVVVESAGAATASGGSHVPLVTPVQSAGAGTAAGGANTPKGTVVQSAGEATASAGPTAADYETEVLADAPTAYWRLGEGAGTTAVDASGNGHDGTYENTPTLGVAGAVSDGDTAVEFDGVDDWVETTTLGSLGSNLGNSSWEFWINTTETDFEAVFGGGSVTQVGAWLNGSTGGLYVDAYDGTNELEAETTATTNLNDGQWHHVVVVIDGAAPEIKVYVDGADQPVTHYTQQTLSPSNFDGPIGIAANNFFLVPADHNTAALDEVAFYPSILTVDRVLDHYNAGLGVVGDSATVLTEEGVPATTIVAPTGEATAGGGANAVIPFEVPTVIRGGGQPTHLVTIVVPPGEAWAEGGDNRVTTREIEHPRVRVHRRKRPQRQPRVRLQPTKTLHAPSGAAYAHAGTNGSRQVETVPLDRILAQDAEFEELLILELI